MLGTFIHKFLQSFCNSSNRPRRLPRILSLERLEGREVPATWAVTNTNPDGMNSLSWAITAANTHMDADATIDVQVAGTISLTNPMQTIGKNVVISTTAQGITVTRAATAGNFRIFEIAGNAVCDFSRVTIDKGRAEQGAGIRNQGTLTLYHCVVKNCETTGQNGIGGGIYNASGATLKLQATDVDHNKAKDGAGIYNLGTVNGDYGSNRVFTNIATGNGGGIWNEGCATFDNTSTIHHNEAANGGGIYTTGCFSAADSSIDYNQASADGGGIYSSGETTISNTQMSYNVAFDDGGAYFVDAGSTEFTTCTFSNNNAVDKGKCGYSKVGTVTRTNCTEQPASDYEEFE